MSGSFIYRHHVGPRVKHYSPREESFPIPLKYIDVSRTTHTNFDLKQEKRIDEYLNIDGFRDLSDPWRGFTQVTLLEERAANRYMSSGERVTRKQLTSRPNHLWPELWTKLGGTERQKWSIDDDWNIDGSCVIRGQVSNNLLYSMKKLQTDICGPGEREIDEKKADIQARSSMARAVEVNGKECQAEGEAKVV